MSDQGYEPTQVGQPAVPAPPGPAAGHGGGYAAPPPGYGPGGGFPPPPDRRPWIIGGLIAAIIVVILAIVLVSAGDDDGDDVATDASTTSSSSTSSSSTSSTSSTSSSTTSTSETTATTAAPSTTQAPAPTIPPTICSAAGDNEGFPEAAAEAVYGAWTRGDEECARVLMTNAAFNQLFAVDGSGATFELQGCGPTPDNPEIDQDCAFFTEGTAMHFFMIFSDTEGWLVTSVTQTAD